MPPLEEFLQQISLYTEQDASSDDESLVTLMTLHNAKGLEYDTVFMVGCEDGAFPHMRALEEGGEEEERRLCYVGITRARQRLYMTWARERRLFGRAERNLPSRFVDELPAELTERHGTAPAARPAGTRPPAETSPGADRARARRSSCSTGDDVVHASFGDGVVTAVEPGGVVVVRFAGDGVRAQADGRLRSDQEAVGDGRAGHRRQGGRRRGAGAGRRRSRGASRPRRADAGAGHRPGRRRPGLRDLRPQQAQGLRGGRACGRCTTASRPRPARRSCWRWSASSATTTRSTASSSSCRVPDQIDPDRVVAAIDPAKDVDGLTPINAGPARPRHARASCPARRPG